MDNEIDNRISELVKKAQQELQHKINGLEHHVAQLNELVSHLERHLDEVDGWTASDLDLPHDAELEKPDPEMVTRLLDNGKYEVQMPKQTPHVTLTIDLSKKL